MHVVLNEFQMIVLMALVLFLRFFKMQVSEELIISQSEVQHDLDSQVLESMNCS